MTKTNLLKQKEMAESRGDSEEVSKVNEQIDELEKRATKLDKQRQENIAGITYVNRVLFQLQINLGISNSTCSSRM